MWEGIYLNMGRLDVKVKLFSMFNPASKFQTDKSRARKHALIVILARHLGILLIVLPQYALGRTSQLKSSNSTFTDMNNDLIWIMIWYFWSMIWYHLIMNHMSSMIATKPIHQAFHPTSTKLHRASVCKSPHLQTNLSSPSIVWALKSKHDLQLNLHVWVMSGCLLSFWFWDIPNYSHYLYLPKGITLSNCRIDGIRVSISLRFETLQVDSYATVQPGCGECFADTVMMMLYCWKNRRTKSVEHETARFLKIPEEYNLFCADGVSCGEFSVVLFR